MTHINAHLLQLFGHPWAAIAAEAQARLLLDMVQNYHIRALLAAGRAAAKRPQPASADAYNLTQAVDRKGPAMLIDEPEPHGFWRVKNWVAF